MSADRTKKRKRGRPVEIDTFSVTRSWRYKQRSEFSKQDWADFKRERDEPKPPPSRASLSWSSWKEREASYHNTTPEQVKRLALQVLGAGHEALITKLLSVVNPPRALLQLKRATAATDEPRSRIKYVEACIKGDRQFKASNAPREYNPATASMRYTKHKIDSDTEAPWNTVDAVRDKAEQVAAKNEEAEIAAATKKAALAYKRFGSGRENDYPGYVPTPAEARIEATLESEIAAAKQAAQDFVSAAVGAATRKVELQYAKRAAQEAAAEEVDDAAEDDWGSAKERADTEARAKLRVLLGENSHDKLATYIRAALTATIAPNGKLTEARLFKIEQRLNNILTKAAGPKMYNPRKFLWTCLKNEKAKAKKPTGKCKPR